VPRKDEGRKYFKINVGGSRTPTKGRSKTPLDEAYEEWRWNVHHKRRAKTRSEQFKKVAKTTKAVHVYKIPKRYTGY